MSLALGELVCRLFAEFLRRCQPDYKRVGVIVLIEKIASGMSRNSGLSGTGGQMSDDATFRRCQGSDDVRKHLTLIRMQGVVWPDGYFLRFRHHRDLRIRC